MITNHQRRNKSSCPNIQGLFDKLFPTLPLFLFTSPKKIK
jgi:hypothetical protein